MPSANGLARRERSTRRVDRPTHSSLGGISVSDAVPPLRHHFRGVSAVVAGDHAMTKARARAADDEGDDLSCPSDPVLACLGPVRPARGAALLARRRGRHSGVQAVHGERRARRIARTRTTPRRCARRAGRSRGTGARATFCAKKTRMRPRVGSRTRLARLSTQRSRRSSRTSPCSASWARRPSRRAVPGPAGRRRGRGRGSAELGTSRGLPRLRAQRAGRATRKEGSFVGQRLRASRRRARWRATRT